MIDDSDRQKEFCFRAIGKISEQYKALLEIMEGPNPLSQEELLKLDKNPRYEKVAKCFIKND